MRNIIIAGCLFFFILILSACVNGGSTPTSEDAVPPVEVSSEHSIPSVHVEPSKEQGDVLLPETIPLKFHPVQLEEIAIQEPKSNWIHVKAMEFGAFEGTQAVLNMYKEGDSSASRGNDERNREDKRCKLSVA
jgi:hypothetical protein